MSLEAFLHSLHFDTNKARQPDWEVDWEDGPLAYKLYRGLHEVPLSHEVPLTLEGRESSAMPRLREISHFLWFIFGLTRVCQSAFTLDSTEQVSFMQSYRRFVPSGGALYPNELYVYLKVEDLTNGVYHYDVAHHRLVLLREGNFDSYLARALGNRCEMSACFGTVFVSTMFWKNFFKYSNFAYRLQGLDAGVLIGQLQEVANRFGFKSGVYFQFLDRAVNHLLGLSEQEESVYAVIPLSVEPANAWFTHENDINGNISATELSQELTAIHPEQFIRSRRIIECPMLVKMNEASLLESLPPFQQVPGEMNDKSEDQAIALPHVQRLSYDMASACRRRYSPHMDFALGKVSQTQLATLLHEATASFTYQNDVNKTGENPTSNVSIYGCFYNVEGIPDGAYHYDSETHTLRRLRLGDHRLQLQYGMSADNVNLFQIPLCLHVAGAKDHLKSVLGYRGYRIQQMEAGMLVQRLLLVASAIGMGGHALLDFNGNSCDEIFKMDVQGKTNLIQVPIGHHRNPSRLEGSLHS